MKKKRLLMPSGHLPLVAHKRKISCTAVSFHDNGIFLAYIFIHPFNLSPKKRERFKGHSHIIDHIFPASSGLPKRESQSPIILEALSDVEKSQGLPTASETHKKRPLTFNSVQYILPMSLYL